MPEYQVYKRRWLVLLTVASLNVSINSLLLSFSSVATSTAFYFEKTPTQVDSLTSVGFLTSVLVAVVATWLVEKLGLK